MHSEVPMILNWEREVGGHLSYGFDEDFGTGIIFNQVSVCISVKGYFLGIHK